MTISDAVRKCSWTTRYAGMPIFDQVKENFELGTCYAHDFDEIIGFVEGFSPESLSEGPLALGQPAMNTAYAR